MVYFNKILIFLKKKARALRILVLLIVISFTLYLAQDREQGLEVEIANCKFKTELAKTAQAHYQGLSNRESMKKNEAMLFLFKNKKVRNFVMRDMYFPLDIIYIRDNQVVNLYQNLIPEGSEPKNMYESSTEVDAVLEINAGLSEYCSIKPGSKVSWK
ncbi:MAG: DUF192 domain-containing protein [Clostridia bacterium]|nr:DUF192 domain-containing protein [Clostridia bacterium]